MAQQQIRASIFDINRRPGKLTFLLTLMLAATPILVPSAQAQSYTVLHSFAGLGDGSAPYAGLTMDRAGNLYGTTAGNSVFKLSRRTGNWTFSTLFDFTTLDQGYAPMSGVIFGPDGSLYGTTSDGGGENSFGVVYNLKPPPTLCRAFSCPWSETILLTFDVGNGAYPLGNLVFDNAGNLYGTTLEGGRGSGVAYELSPSHGSWTETVLDYFSGEEPYTGFAIDGAGNLYSTTCVPDGGVIYELNHAGWQFQTLFSFDYFDGSNPFGGVIFDSSGNLYGGTECGGTGHDGTIFELSPSGGGWTLNTLYNFGNGANECGGPYARLTMDASGNLYGTTYAGGAYLYGSVFKLSPSDGGWEFTDLHDFCASGPPCSDGAYPYSTVVFDSEGNLYGTASKGGAHNLGVVWEITP